MLNLVLDYLTAGKVLDCEVSQFSEGTSPQTVHSPISFFNKGLFCAQLPLNLPSFLKKDLMEIPAIAKLIAISVSIKVGMNNSIRLKQYTTKISSIFGTVC